MSCRRVSGNVGNVNFKDDKLCLCRGADSAVQHGTAPFAQTPLVSAKYGQHFVAFRGKDPKPIGSSHPDHGCTGKIYVQDAFDKKGRWGSTCSAVFCAKAKAGANRFSCASQVANFARKGIDRSRTSREVPACGRNRRRDLRLLRAR